MSLSRKRVNAHVNLQHVATAAGVSAMTVSRSLRGIEGVSDKKRSEIAKIAKRMNYFPNNNARSLVVANSDLVGISFPTFFNDVFADMLEGMRFTFERAGLSTVIDTTSYDPDVEHSWISRVMSWHPAAIVLTGNDHHPDVKRKLRRAEIPTLELWDVSSDPIDICVGIDHFKAGLDIGQFAVERGYRKPGFVGIPSGRDIRADKRKDGIKVAFERSVNAKPLVVSIQENSNSFLAGKLGTIELLAQESPPDILFYVNDHLAFGGISACQSLGIKVPQDVGIVGFNALDLTSVLPVPLTTMSTPRRHMGIVAAQNLISRIKGVQPERVVSLEFEIIEGATTRRIDETGSRIAGPAI